MKFYLFIILVTILNTNNFAQTNHIDIHKYVYKHYSPSKEISKYCAQNYSIVYLKSNDDGKIMSISSMDDLGRLIIPDLKFLEGYDIHQSNKTIGLFFILQNIESCTECSRGFNETSGLIENLIRNLDQQKNNTEFILDPIIIKIGFTFYHK